MRTASLRSLKYGIYFPNRRQNILCVIQISELQEFLLRKNIIWNVYYFDSVDGEANMLTFFLNHAIWVEMQMYSCIRIHSADYSSSIKFISFLTQKPTHTPKPAYVLQWWTTKMLPIPSNIIKEPHSIWKMAEFRRIFAR